MKNTLEEREDLLPEVIIESIKNKKGRKIVNIDLTKVENSVCDNFIICHADSTTQVSAIADEIAIKTKELTGIRPAHIEGMANSQWVLLDYLYIVVHIFLNEYRDFYRLEELWADGKFTLHED